MSSQVGTHSNIQFLATYGTLRDDDNSGAAWTNDFIKDISGAITGRLPGYQLYKHSEANYPYAIFTGNSKDSIVVRLLRWPTQEQFQEQINLGDIIEGDTYERKIVEVSVENGTKLAYIYVSKSNSLDKEWTVIPSGDWLQRNSK